MDRSFHETFVAKMTTCLAQQRALTKPSRFVGVLVLCSFASPFSISQAIHNGPPLITLHQIKTDLSTPNGTASSACLVIFSDGLYHLEQRTQTLPVRTATLTRSEGLLAPADFDSVRTLLASQSVIDLPKYVLPEIPVTNNSLENVRVEIRRGESIQEVGYSVWLGPELKDSIEGSRSEVASAQFRSQRSIRPLLELKDRLETSSAKPAPSSPACS